jgi:hypothetical protein
MGIQKVGQCVPYFLNRPFASGRRGEQLIQIYLPDLLIWLSRQPSSWFDPVRPPIKAPPGKRRRNEWMDMSGVPVGAGVSVAVGVTVRVGITVRVKTGAYVLVEVGMGT